MEKKKILIIVTLVCALIAATIGIAVVAIQGNSKPEEKNAEHYTLRGDDYYDEGEYTMALACYTKALTLDDTWTGALHGEAKTNSALGYAEDALASYEKLAVLVPEDGNIQLEWVNAMISAGQLGRAKSTMEDLLKTFDDPRMEDLYDQMTVKKPVADLASGIYDSYQLVHLTSDNKNSALYYTLDGSDPTANSMTCGEKLVLSAPINNLRVKCINYLGYESDVLSLDVSISVPVQQVMNRSYSSLSFAVREALKKSYYDPIYNYELAQITELYVVADSNFSNASSTVFYRDSFTPGGYTGYYTYRGDGNMRDLKYMPFLETLAVCWQRSVNLKDIAALPNLKHLSLLNNNITDIAPLAQMTGLETLALGWNNIKDVKALASLTELTSLGLWNNKITDITPLAALNKLTYLDVANNQITAIDATAQLTSLQEFWGNGNQISFIGPLDPKGNLQVLMMAGNPLEDYASWKQEHPGVTRTDIIQ